jgi:hypothetical protein
MLKNSVENGTDSSPIDAENPKQPAKQQKKPPRYRPETETKGPLLPITDI